MSKDVLGDRNLESDISRRGAVLRQIARPEDDIPNNQITSIVTARLAHHPRVMPAMQIPCRQYPIQRANIESNIRVLEQAVDRIKGGEEHQHFAVGS